MRKVSVIDYGMGNILSVERSLEYCGAQVEIVNKHKEIIQADLLVLPGVGAFKNAMKELENLEIIESIQSFLKKGNPFMGICLGMQMMLEASIEFGYTKGLGVIAGQVEVIPNTTVNGITHKVPHVGWTQIYMPEFQAEPVMWDKTILKGISNEDFFYFVHSFTAKPDEKFRLADAEYGGRKISAVIKKDNLYGCQFHPEKSGEAGLRIIQNFVNL